MRVLQIDVNCKYGSTGQIAYNLFTYINSKGHEACVCYGRGEKIKENGLYKFGLDWETYLHAFLTKITGYTGCFSFFSTHRLIEFIKQFNPDIVHIHEMHAYFVNIKPLLRYLKEKKINTVMTLHCEFAYTGKCGHSLECVQWKTECRKCPRLRKYISTFWFDHTRHMFNQKKSLYDGFNNLFIVTPSEWLAERARQSILKKHSIYVIHNGIDTDVFFPRETAHLREELGIPNDAKVVLALAPHLMTEGKGGRYVLDIAERLQKENIWFVLVGVDEQYSNNLPKVIMKEPIKDRERIAEYYSMADAFVICSKRENYPTTCLEAQACGTVVYGFDNGGIRETTSYDTNHFVKDYNHIDELAEMISNQNILGMAERRNNSISVKKRISMEEAFKQYFALYERINSSIDY